MGACILNNKSDKIEELWVEYKKTNNQKIREKLVEEYAHIVKYIVGRIAINMPPNIEYEDLISYGTIGLLDAIDKYDPEKGVKFNTYAAMRIRGAIFDELRLMDWTPRLIRQKSKVLEDTYSKLENELGRPVNDEEVANALNISLDEFYEMLNEVNGNTIISLSEVWYLDNEDELTIADTIEDESSNPLKEIEKEEVKEILISAIDNLPEKERLVISLYYYDELTLKEIGQVLELTESRVSQLHSKAILRLRGKLGRIKSQL